MTTNISVPSYLKCFPVIYNYIILSILPKCYIWCLLQAELSLKNSLGIPFLIFCEMFWKKKYITASVVPLIVMYIKEDIFPECSNSTFWLSLYLEKLKLKTSNSNLTY